jgi:hypothetical protein
MTRAAKNILRKSNVQRAWWERPKLKIPTQRPNRPGAFKRTDKRFRHQRKLVLMVKGKLP